MKDLSGPEYLEVVISEDGKTLWINDEFTCLFRACRIRNFKLDDRRRKEGDVQ